MNTIVEQMKAMLLIAGYTEQTNSDIASMWSSYWIKNGPTLFISNPGHEKHPCINMGVATIDYNYDSSSNRPATEETLYYLECFLSRDV